MSTINISGQAPGAGTPEPALTPEQKTLKALYDKNMQAQLRQMQYVQNLRRKTETEQLASIGRETAAREAAMRKAMAGFQNYEKQKTAGERTEAQTTERTAARETAAREAAMRKAMAGFQNYEKIKARGAAKDIVDANKRAEAEKREQALQERSAQSARHARVRGWAGAARTGAIAVAGIHGDFEGITTAIGGLMGSIAGPLGAEIGAVAGEVLGKLAIGAVTAPMAPGNLWQSYLSVSRPWMDLKTDAYSMARAGGYSGEGSINSVLPPGSFGASQPAWMKLAGATPESVFRSINQTGINPRSQEEFSTLGQTLALTGNTRAYANLPDGLRERALGQGLNYGATDAAGSSKYLGSFAGTLEEAVARGVDKGRVFSNMLEAIDNLAKGGASGVSSAAVNEAFMRFMMTGTPGGRSGEAAAASLAGTSNMLSNPLQNSSGMYGLMSVAQKFGGLRSTDSIKKMIGERALSAFSANNPDGQAYTQSLIDQAARAAQSGNLPMALDTIAPIMNSDPGRVQDLMSDTFGSGGASDYIVGSMTGRSAQQVRQANFGRSRMPTTSPNGYDDQMAGLHVASGTGNDADAARVLKSMGVPDDYIPMVLAAAKKTGQDPVKIAAIMWHESRFKAGAINRNTNGTTDFGLMQTNDKWAAGDMAAAGISPQDLANARGGTPLDPQKSIMAGAMHLRAAGGDLTAYAGDNPTGRAASAQEQEFIRAHLTPNVPTDVNEARAMGGAAVDTGSRDMFTNLNSAIKVVSTTAESAANAVRTFADSLDGLKSAGVNISGPSEAQKNWALAGGNNVSPVAQRTNHFHVQQ